MDQAEAGRVVAYLNAGFPRDALEPESFAIWVGAISELVHYEPALQAAKIIVRNADRFPTIKEFRQTYRQAYDRWIAGYELEMPDDSVPPPPEALAMLARMRGGTLLRSIDDLPVSDAIVARPVWARYLRRKHGSDLVPSDGLIRPEDPAMTMFPPTDDEKHDAILVLRDEYDFALYDAAQLNLWQEALRIMEECSA